MTRQKGDSWRLAFRLSACVTKSLDQFNLHPFLIIVTYWWRILHHSQILHTDVFASLLLRFSLTKNGLFLTLSSGISSARNENLRPLLNRNITLNSGTYGLRNHFWPLENGFLMRRIEKKGPNFLGRHDLYIIGVLTSNPTTWLKQNFWVFFLIWHLIWHDPCEVYISFIPIICR